MQKTLLIKLLPNKKQLILINQTMNNYINTVNALSKEMHEANSSLKLSSKDVFADLPSALKNQCIRDAKSIYKKQKKGVTKTLAVLKKPQAVWNNQNYSFEEQSLAFPVWLNKSKKVSVKALITDEQLYLLNTHKLGSLRITPKNGKLIAQIALEVAKAQNISTREVVMGIDLGIKVPAVCATSEGQIKFTGNGRKNKWLKRYYAHKRRKLGKAKKIKAIRKLNDKEQRIMKDIDHKISREVVNFALKNKVTVIHMEQLSNIRKTTRTSRKNNRSLHTWSFYRLANYIEYKAKLVGIEVNYVNPAYTSQLCPACGTKNKASDRNYHCSACGHTDHRDIVGAKNIIAPMIDGNSLSA